MNKMALFVRHRAKAGMRSQVEGVWAEHVKPRVETNADHEAYFFCHDAEDPDVVCVFQLFRNAEAIQEFMSGDWYPRYLAEVSQVVAEAPQIVQASPTWIKPGSLAGSPEGL